MAEALSRGSQDNITVMLVDLAKFRPKRMLEPGLLWVVEQIPGLVQVGVWGGPCGVVKMQHVSPGW